MQITVADERTSLSARLESWGWSKVARWVSLVKWLDESARPKDDDLLYEEHHAKSV